MNNMLYLLPDKSLWMWNAEGYWVKFTKDGFTEYETVMLRHKGHELMVLIDRNRNVGA